jgi:DNA polymerase III subunit alpha
MALCWASKSFTVHADRAEIKPILGCETYVASRSIEDKTGKEDRSGDHLILLAKNLAGYQNLIKLISIANIEGFYYKPVLTRTLLEKHADGLIVSSACLGGEIPTHIYEGKLEQAEETIAWYKNLFGEDFYLELMRHPSELPQLREEVYNKQVVVNEHLIRLARKFDIKLIATNDIHFINAEDADAHDLLICLNTGKDLDDPNRMRYTKQEWFKTTAEMNKLFADIPESIANTAEVVAKIEDYKLDNAPIMPVFPIPAEFGDEEDFRGKLTESGLKEEFTEESYTSLGGFEKVARIKFEAEYLRHLTYEGALLRYGNPLPEHVTTRLDFELDVIKNMGFPGYFLITADFINAARKMGVLVGPGRGSAAGAAVSYCTGITNILTPSNTTCSLNVSSTPTGYRFPM